MNRIKRTLLYGMDIVKEGKAQAKIVVPDEPSAVAVHAAEEFQHHIQRATGVKLEIIPERKAALETEAYIYIGPSRASEKAGIGVLEMEPNEFVIKVTRNALFLVGKDSPGFRIELTYSDPADMGTLFAVYEWLDKQLQVKWLWPGELGTVVPRVNHITAGPVGERKISPRFVHTRLRYGYLQEKDWRGAVSREAFENQMLDTGMWLRRHRLVAGPMSFEYGHDFLEYWERFGETHPEFFALRPDGVRAPKGAPEHVQMCVSNPEFHKQIVADWLEDTGYRKRTPRRPWINCAENDKHGDPMDPPCHCPNCQAWDVIDVEAGDHILDPSPDIDPGKGLTPVMRRSLSDRYAKFYLAVQAEARKHDPDAIIVAYAYAGYVQPPVETKLNENIIVWIVPPYWFPLPPDKRDDFRKLWDGWAKTGARLVLRPNYFLAGYSMPYIFAREFGEEFRYAAKHGMIGTDFDSLTGMWGVQGPNLYMLGRIHERYEMGVDMILDEYYSGFGPAAKEVRKYFDYWEKVTRGAAGYYGWFNISPQDLLRVFTLESFKKGFKLLDAAYRATAKDTEYRARVEFLHKGLKHAELAIHTTIAFQRHSASPRDDKLRQAFHEALKNLDEFRASIEKERVVDIPYSAWSEKQTWPREQVRMLAGFELIKQLPLFWQFKWDPKEIGREEKWFAEDLNTKDWLKARTDEWWEDQGVGKRWKKKYGEDYNGLAWYRTTFTITPDYKGRKISIYFGAVDEAAIVWVNGSKVLDRPYPYKGDKDSWRKPFMVDISKVVRFGSTNTVVVEVEDRAGKGGIYKPASIVAD